MGKDQIRKARPGESVPWRTGSQEKNAEWSEWVERHGRYSREVAVERCGRQPRYNGASGSSDMAGNAARVAVERCGKQPRYNGASGSSDMHGNAARVAESEAGAERMNGSTVGDRRYSEAADDAKAGAERMNGASGSSEMHGSEPDWHRVAENEAGAERMNADRRRKGESGS